MTTAKVADWIDVIADKCIKMPALKARAQELGINAGKLRKADLIHEIQQAEGFTPCYGTAAGQCDNTPCCFITDCNKIK